MRIQLSLTINDPKVYEMCSHLKEAKELNTLVVRLLTAYVYQDEGVVDVAGADIDNTPPEQKDYSEDYESIRESLMMLDILSEDASNLFSSSAQTLEDYMEGAVNTGVFTEEKNEDGESVPVPNVKLLTKKQKSEDDGSPEMFDMQFVKNMFMRFDKSMDTLIKDVNNIKKYVNYPKADEESSGESPEFKEQSASDEVAVAETPVVDEDPVEEPYFEVEDQEEGVSFEDVSAPVEHDARSAIGDLLSSL